MDATAKGLPDPAPKVKKFYVYELRDDTGKVFYVGKGNGNRMRHHRSPATQKPWRHLYKKIAKMWREGKDYTEHKVFESEDEKECFAEEVRRIAFYGRANLTNTTDGGEGPSGYQHTEASRRRMSQSYNGKRGDEHYSRTNPERLARGDRNGVRKHPEKLPRGDAHKNSKLTEETVYALRELYMEGVVPAEMVPQSGVTFSVMYNALMGRTWKHVPFPAGFAKQVKTPKVQKERQKVIKRTEEEVQDIRRRAREGETYRSIGILYGVTEVSIRDIATGRSYAKVGNPEDFVKERTTLLTDEKVMDARLRYYIQKETQQSIANSLGLSRCSVSEILSGKTYTRVPFPEGCSPRGSNPLEKLTDEQVVEMRAWGRLGQKLSELSQRFGVSRQQVKNILSGKSRKSVS